MRDVNERHGRETNAGLADSGNGIRDPLEEVAAEFAQRIRQGERVTVEQYASLHPQLAGEIRDLFPTIEVMEEVNAKQGGESGPRATIPEQLGDYRILSEIARGGMGIVYEAEQVSLGRKVAVKVLPSHALRQERDVRRFEREAQTAANLHHSNIVPVFGIGEESGQRYIVMQLIRGVGLDEILNEVKRIVINGAGQDTADPTSRLSTVKRSAAGLLENQLKLMNSTSVDMNAETVETALSGGSASPRAVAAWAIGGTLGAEYFRNVARMGLQAAEAIHYAHQHETLHRDIKPGNLILDEEGRVWVADFGLAKAVQDDEVTCSGDVVGTMAYVAPERFQGRTTKSSDIYSLGVTLHEMLTLQKAFDGNDRMAVMSQVANIGLTSPRKLNRSVPRDLDTIVMKAAARDARDRYRSARALADDLEAFLEDRPINARRLSQIEKSARWCRRNRAITALLVLLAITVGLLGLSNRRAQQQRLKEAKVSKLALGALDEIYDRFASTPLTATVSEEQSSDEEFVSPLSAASMPISKDVASLLENLLAFYEELSKQSDDSDLVTVKLIGAGRRVADINQRLGQLDDARDSYEDAIDRLKRLGPQLRETSAMRLETARVYNGLGGTFVHDRRNSRDRVRAHQNAVAILDHDDATKEEQFELATSLYLLHRAEQQRNWNRSNRWHRHAQAGAGDQEACHLDRAEAILAGLKASHPGLPEYDLLLARCLLAKRDGRELNSELQNAAIAILEGLVDQYPDNPDYQFELGQVYQSVERQWSWHRRDERRGKQQLVEAENRLRRGLEVTADLEGLHPNIPKYYLLKKELHEHLGQILRTQGNYSEAQSEYVRAIQMQRMLMNRSERPAMHRPGLYRLKLEYGKLLRDAGELERAKASLVKTARQLEEIVSESTQSEEPHVDRSRFRRRGRDDSRRTLESTYIVLASVFDKLGDDDASRGVMHKMDELDR